MVRKRRNTRSGNAWGILLILMVGSLLLLSACNDKNDGVGVLIGLSQPSLIDDYQKTIKSEVTQYCDRNPEVRCVSFDAGFDELSQIQDIERLLQLGVDALIVVTTDPEPLEASLAAAYDSGIPVIIIGYVPDGSKHYTSRIFIDHVKLGNKIGQYLCEFGNNRNYTILEVVGEPNAMISNDLRKGFTEAIGRYDNVRREYIMTGYWSQDKTVTRLEESAFHEKVPSIDAIFAHNNAMAIGASLAARNFIGNVNIVGIGVYPLSYGDRQALMNGQIQAAFLIPNGGKEAVDAALEALDHNPMGREIELHPTVVTKESLKTPMGSTN